MRNIFHTKEINQSNDIIRDFIFLINAYQWKTEAINGIVVVNSVYGFRQMGNCLKESLSVN